MGEGGGRHRGHAGVGKVELVMGMHGGQGAGSMVGRCAGGGEVTCVLDSSRPHQCPELGSHSRPLYFIYKLLRTL